MRIALLAPIWNQVAQGPKLYGVLAVVRDLALGLQKKGHQVTLFCAAGSKVSVDTFDSLEFSLEEKKIPMFGSCESVFLSFQAAARALKEAEGKFDIIHSHMDFFPLPFTPFLKTPMVTTIHGAWFSQGAKKIFYDYQNSFFVSLSLATRKNLPGLNYLATVYNGIDLSQFKFSQERGGYLLFLGRFVADKGADLAIKAAQQAKTPLLLAGTVHDAEQAYLQSKVREKVDGKKICFVGAVHGERKASLLKNALALLFPIRWQEPFGLVMAEAMACGTPVIAFNRGSVPEIVRDGVTGFVVEPGGERSPRLWRGSPRLHKKNWQIKKIGVVGMVAAVKKIQKLSDKEMRQFRRNCRQHVEKNFTIEKMVESYEKVYQEVVRRFSKEKKV